MKIEDKLKLAKEAIQALLTEAYKYMPRGEDDIEEAIDLAEQFLEVMDKE